MPNRTSPPLAMEAAVSLNIVALNELIAHLEKQPEERFNMGFVERRHPTCGTVCCIHGHALSIWSDGGLYELGLSNHLTNAIALPDGYELECDGVRRYPLSRAIATLKRLRDVYEATGKVVVDWGPEPGEVPAGKPWAAPVVSPNLPISLTKALHGVDRSLTVEEPVA